MPFRRPMMSQLLLQNREVDEAVRAAVDEARARARIYGVRTSTPLKTLGWNGREPSPLPRLDDAA